MRIDHRAAPDELDRAEAAGHPIAGMTLAELDAAIDAVDVADTVQLRRLLKDLARMIVGRGR